MATSSALLVEWAWTNNREGMAGCNGGWEMRCSGKEALKALDASLGECTPKVYRALPQQYKTENINVKKLQSLYPSVRVESSYI